MLTRKGGNSRILGQCFLALVIFAVCSINFVLIDSALAISEAETGIQEINESNIGLQGGSLVLMIARIIRAFFGLLGIAAVGYIVYGGFVWMTAGGDEGKVNTAKKIMLNATIGMAIMLSAFGIASFIIRALVGSPGGYIGEGSIGQNIPPGYQGGFALGQTIEYVLPTPGEKDVYRDTGIIVQFKKHINPKSLLVDDANYKDENPLAISGTLNTNNVKIYRTDAGINSAMTADSFNATVSEMSNFVGGIKQTKTLLTITLKGDTLFGQPNDNTKYTVQLSGNIQKYDELGTLSPAFSSLNGYIWSFEVGTKIDLYPPQITSVYPAINSGNNYRNVTILVNFNKAMLPTQILGNVYMNVSTGNSDNFSVATGTWKISNLARTAEFTAPTECGKSACGDQYYCFPANITVSITAMPGTIDATRGAPKATTPYDGLVSLTGNSLDGNNNGVAEGPQLVDEMYDTKIWSFGVGSVIDTESPKINSYAPTVKAAGGTAQEVPLDGSLNAIYNEVLLPSTISTVNLIQPSGLEQWYYPSTDALDESSNTITNSDTPINQMRVNLNHAPFLASDEDVSYLYMPSFTEGIKDAQNNCYVPGAGPGCGYSSEHTEKIYKQPWCCGESKQTAIDGCKNTYENYKIATP